MKIRSLLLGSVAAAGLSTGAFAADLGVLPSFDICDDLGLSGLTISSEDNCLVITGGVEYTFTWGDYTGTADADADFFGPGGYATSWDAGDGINDWESELDAWLQFAATSSTDFGKAKAVIKITNDSDQTWYDSEGADGYDGSGFGEDLKFDEAYVSIGDTTVITAGKTGSIFNSGDDEPLDWLGGFISDRNDDDANPGVGFYNNAGEISVDSLGGGAVIQVTHDLGNGFSVSGALEDLDSYGNESNGTGIGVVAYSGEGISAHLSVAAFNILGDGPAIEEKGWAVHAGFAGEFENFKVILAGAALNQDDYTFWNVLASASATFDIFTIAGAVEAAGDEGGTYDAVPDHNAFGISGSISAEVTEGVSLNLGGRWTDEDDLFAGDDGVYEIAAGVTADVTETLEASAKVGFVDDGWADLFYGEAGLTWKPGGDYEAGVSAAITSEDAYSIETTFKKEFK